ncbi:MAG: alpha/beta fold hydrolase [Anaerolineales bacterium]|jgi:pimeloyl-ACP methyl ester carboxylesterase
MIDTERLIFVHGLEGSSQGVKAQLLRELFPGICIPDFSGSLEERVVELATTLEGNLGWTIIGSSFGGLMGAIYTCRNPDHVKQLVLLAPALIWPDFANSPPEPISVPVVVYHGMGDEVIPLEPVRALAEMVFLNLDFRVVDDDHGLFKTVHAIDWITLLEGE